MEEINETNIYQEEMSKDKNAIEAFVENIYVNTNPFQYPKPKKEILNFWEFSGVKTSLFVLQAIGAAVLSAIRTGGIFFIIELKLSEKFHLDSVVGNGMGWLSLIASLLAFEFFLLAKGFSDGEKLDRLNESNIGMIISFIVTIGAGIFSGFGIIKTNTEFDFWANLAVALITGAGASAMAYFGAENLGFSLKQYKSKVLELDDIYKKKIEEFNDLLAVWKMEAADAYHKSKYNARRKDSFFVQKDFKNTSIPVENENAIQNPIKNEKKRSKNEICREFIDSFVTQHNSLPTIDDIVTNLKFSGGLASNCLQQYIYEFGSILVAEKIITQKKYDDVCKKFDVKEEIIEEQPQQNTESTDPDGW